MDWICRLSLQGRAGAPGKAQGGPQLFCDVLRNLKYDCVNACSFWMVTVFYYIFPLISKISTFSKKRFFVNTSSLPPVGPSFLPHGRAVTKWCLSWRSPNTARCSLQASPVCSAVFFSPDRPGWPLLQLLQPTCQMSDVADMLSRCALLGPQPLRPLWVRLLTPPPASSPSTNHLSSPAALSRDRENTRPRLLSHSGLL